MTTIVRPLPKWIMQKYAVLWKQFSESSFEHSEALGVLKENTSVIISYLKKHGWVEVALHPEDSRKRVYKLKSPEQAISEMADGRT
ncbi:MarR family transcriptional regulator [Nanoarchaeota archaeon]